MSNYDKRKIVRLFGDGKSYVISSNAIENEKLQIKIVDSAICLTKLSNDEWLNLTQFRTNSVKNASFSLILDSYGCLGALSTVSPMSANLIHYLLFVKDATCVGTVKKCDIMKITDVYILPLNLEDLNAMNNFNSNLGQNPNYGYINDLKKFLSSGVFYFSYSTEPSLKFDLTLSSQFRNTAHATRKKYLWNYNLIIPFRRLNVDVDQWLLKLICGFVDIKKTLISHKTFKTCIFSRLSCEKAGTRFNCRGINDDGNVANFVETEQLIYSNDTEEESSFIQIRGSVPVFFEQTGLQVGNHRIKILRSLEAGYPAFERHFKSLFQEYGSKFYVLNLLGIKGDEEILTDCYMKLLKGSAFYRSEQLKFYNFDYHSELKLNKQSLSDKMWNYLVKEFYINPNNTINIEGMFFHMKPEANESNSEDNQNEVNIKRLQTKYVRTNCMDCLDRTNNVQTFIGIEMLRYQLNDSFGIINEMEINKFREVFRQMWILNGDSISKIYAGTGAIQGKSVTQDISRSLTRAIQNNFLDNNKQDAIDIILFTQAKNYGDIADRIRILMPQNLLRLSYPILREMISNYRQYVEITKCKICIGTWNINGGLASKDMDNLDLNEWLINGPLNSKNTGFGYLDPSIRSSSLKIEDIDIFAIGFEEIVDLNASNIVSASDINSLQWYDKIYKFLRTKGEYVPIVVEPLQLVGVCLFVFVLKKHVSYVRDVCVSRNKTGLGGTAGNKGGVLLRFVFYNTSMCFVCSHFAAHQNKIKERNEDFRQIYEASEFSSQLVTKTDVKSHDYVFWCGDLNYRIDMPNDRCRNLIAECEWNTLLELDQLKVQMNEQNVFRDFIEAPISFPPTYKYNLYEDSYDRSEKCRVPAWTDRILWRRRKLTRAEHEDKNFSNGKCLYYGRADIRYSDHRPVCGLLEVEVNKVIPSKLMNTLDKVFNSTHGSLQVTLVVSNHSNMMNDEIKHEIIRLFSAYRSFAGYKEVKNLLYITYMDARFAYDAYGQYNNFHLENYDLILQVRVENEDDIRKIIEYELSDCLAALLHVDTYTRKLSSYSQSEKEPVNVQTADLLGVEDDGEIDSTTFINVPSQIHSSLSITNNMHSCRALDLESEIDGHQYHNPLVKALSNSNLNMFDHPAPTSFADLSTNHHHASKYAHSAVNLLDLSNDEMKASHLANDSIKSFNLNANPAIPPRRPPPPPTSQPKLFEDIGEEKKETELTANRPLIEIHCASSNSNSLFNNEFDPFNAFDNQSTQSNAPIDPFDPFQATATPADSKTSITKFSLFDDDFGDNLLNQVNEKPSTFASSIVKETVQPVLRSAAPPQLPPLPPLPPMSAGSSSSSQPSMPPPLPPMPASINNNSIYQPNNNQNKPSTLTTNQPTTDSAHNLTKVMPPRLPPRPNAVQPSQPAANQPVISQSAAPNPFNAINQSNSTKSNVLLNFDDHFGSLSLNNQPQADQANQSSSKVNTNLQRPPPLPPRPNNSK